MQFYLFIYISASSVLTVNKVTLIHFSEWDVMDRETWNQIIMCLAGILNEGMSIPHNCTHTNTHMQTIYLVYSAEWPPACRLSPGGRPQRPSSRQTACWTRTNHMHPGQKNSKRRMEQHLGRTQIGVIFYWNSVQSHEDDQLLSLNLNFSMSDEEKDLAIQLVCIFDV